MDLAAAQAQLDAWTAASLALAKGQSYAIGDRQLTRSNAGEVLQMVNYWQRQVDQLSSPATARKPAMVATWSA